MQCKKGKNTLISRSFCIKKSFLFFAAFFVFSGTFLSWIYAATVTNGDVTIDVLDYDPVNGWEAGVVYDGKVTVDFGDTTSLNKEIVINLPEGMRFVNYPVVGTPASGSPGYTVESGSILEQFISSVTEPSEQTYYPSYNGALTYQITQACESIEVPFKLTVDENVYYGPKTITDAIGSSASKGGVNIGDASMNVGAAGYAVISTWSDGWTNPTTALAGSTENVTLPSIRVYRTGDYNGGLFYMKEVEAVYYYPKEVEGVTTTQPDKIEEINDTNGYVRSRWNNVTYFGLHHPTVSVTNTAAGTYSASSKVMFDVTMYDETVMTITSQYPVVQIDALASIDNKLQISSYNVGYYKQSDDYYIVGPRFQVSNDQASVKTDQRMEYTIDPNYEVIQTVFPKDPSLGVIGDVQYKTNINSTLRTASISQIIEGGNQAYISKETLGLSENEYITYATASIGDVSKGYESVYSINYGNAYARIVGKLKDGVDTANVTIRTYATLPDDSLEPNSETSVTKTVTRDTTSVLTFDPNSYNVSINAGETVPVNFLLANMYYYRSSSLGGINPTAYIRLPENVNIDTGSVRAVSNHDGDLPITVEGPYTSAVSGERFVRVDVTGKAGNIFNDISSHTIDLRFNLIAGLGAGGNYDWSEYVFWKFDHVPADSYLSIWGRPNNFTDIIDIDNDGDVSEYFLPVYDDRTLSIISKEELLIDTYIIPEGGERQVPYDGTQDTAIGFTPGTTATYTVDMLNNRTDSVNSTTAYIPIPKDGNNFGTNFQDNEFYWNMKLSGTPTVTVYDEFGTDITSTAASNYAITYSDNAISEANYESATYTGTPSTSTTMIKVENTVGIPAGEQAILEFDYVVDETIASVTADPTKLGATNDFKPYYYFNSGTSGWQSGTKVGAILQIGQIAGQVFLDQDIDGIYNNSDTLLENKTVDLYKHDGSTYVFQSTTTTDVSGHYAFDELPNGNYRVNFTNVPTAAQQFTKQNHGTDESLDSDPDYTGTQKGYVDSIDPTDATAQNTDAGIINYDPTTELNVTLNKATTSIKKTNAQTTFTEQLTETITPSFFDSIKATAQPITWSSSDPTTVSVSNGLIQGSQTGTATITLTIKDIYGNTDTAQTTVTVTSNDIPTITANDITIDLYAQFDPLENVTASDTEDGDITDRVIITENDLDVQTPGTYTITYAAEDNDGNIARIDRAVTVRSITPTVSTGSVSEVTLSQVTINANVIVTGGEEVTREIEWGTAPGTYTSTCIAPPGTDGFYSCTITGLSDSAIYYYRAKVTNSVGTGYGQEKSFTTQAAKVQQSTISTKGTITISGDAVLGGN